MKRLLFCSVLLVVCVTVFAQIDVSAGAHAGYLYADFTYKYKEDADNYLVFSQVDNVLGFGAFVDATYVRLNAEYAMSLNATQKTVLCVAGSKSESSADSPDGYSMHLLNVFLLGKYPIALGPVTIWPTAGALYSMLLSWDNNGDGVDDDLSTVARNDVYVVAGCGIDFPITQQIFLTGSALFNWDLMPVDEKGYDPAPEETYTQWFITARVGVGFRF